MEKVKEDIINETRKAIIISIAAMVIFFALNYTLTIDPWIGLITVLVTAFFGPFVLDLINSWFGSSWRIRNLILLSLILIEPFGTLIFMLVWGVNFSSSSVYAFMMFFLAAIGVAFASFTYASQKLLRTFKGIRTSGDWKRGIIGLVIPGDVAREYSIETIENQIEGIISSGLKSVEIFSFIRKKDSDQDYNIAKAADINILYRVKERDEYSTVDILCIPLDGIVARFENASALVENLTFSLRQVFGFGPNPGEKETKDIVGEIQSAYENLRNPASKQIAINIAKVVAIILVIGIIIAFLAAQDWNSIWNSLADQKTTNILGSIASIVIITVVGVIGLIKYLMRKKVKGNTD